MSSLSLDQLTLSSPRLILPPEIIDEILRDDQLSKADLARCCLLSRQFLPVPQNQLYQSIRLNFFVDSNMDYWFHDLESELLLSTLEMKGILRRKVKELSLVAWDVEPADPEEYSEDESNNSPSTERMVRRILSLLDAVRTLKVNGRLWAAWETKDLVTYYGECWEVLAVEGVVFGGGFHPRRSWSQLPNLKKLSCFSLSLDSSFDWTVPSKLQVLVIFDDERGVLKGSATSQLRTARLPLNDDKLRYIDTYPVLQHLHLFQTYDDNRINFLPQISKLSRLQTLSFHLVDDQVFAAETLPAILANLPRSLFRLQFPKIVPFAAISSFLESTLPPHLSIVGVNLKSEMDITQQEELKQLRVLCELKGIEIEQAYIHRDTIRTFCPAYEHRRLIGIPY